MSRLHLPKSSDLKKKTEEIRCKIFLFLFLMILIYFGVLLVVRTIVLPKLALKVDSTSSFLSEPLNLRAVFVYQENNKRITHLIKYPNAKK